MLPTRLHATPTGSIRWRIWIAFGPLPTINQARSSACVSWPRARPLTGFTHYLEGNDDGWLESEEADALFVEAGEQRLLASIHCGPHLVDAVCRLAARHPRTPVLLHHMGHTQADDPGTVDRLLACAPVENVYVKVSGFYYCTSGPGWDFPCRDVQTIVRRLYETRAPAASVGVPTIR